MKENLYEVNLRKMLRMSTEPLSIKSIGDSSPVFEQLMKIFPVIGSKIDWDHVPGSIQQNEKVDDFQLPRFISFFDEVVQKFRLAGEVIYVGDSVTDFALEGPIDCIREVLVEVLAIPQHHYFVSPNFAWCMCFTMEGDMSFGIAPSRAKIH
jgi:hypothetical protein